MPATGVGAALLLGGSAWLTWETAREFRAQQRHIEEGTRRRIGEWLHAHAAPGDTERQMDILREVHHAAQFRLLAQDLEGSLTVERLAAAWARERGASRVAAAA